MHRRIFLILSLFALTLATVAPAVADDKEPKGAGSVPNGKALGKISAINGANWTLTTDANTSQTVDVSGARVKWPGRKNATLGEFKVGDQVAVKLQNHGRGKNAQPSTTTSATPKASMVHLIPGKTFTHFAGEVTATSISGDSGTFTVKNAQNETKTFTVSAATTLRPKNKTLADIKGGEKVTVVSRAADTANAALAVHLAAEDTD